MEVVEWLWEFCIGFTVLVSFYIHLFPQRLVRLTSIPPVLCFQNCFGETSLKLQALAYISIHSNIISRLSHVMLLDAVAWTILLRHYDILFIAITALIFMQLVSFNDLKFFLFATFYWISSYSIGTFFLQLYGVDDVVFYSKVVLLTTPVLREFGHLTVPTPPWILVNPSPSFQWTPTTAILQADATEWEASILLFGTSFIFEFNAGLPVRLPSVFCYTELYLPLCSLWSSDVYRQAGDLYREALRVQELGWHGSAVTSSVFVHNPIMEASKLQKLSAWNHHEDPSLEEIDLDGVIQQVQEWAGGQFQSWAGKGSQGGDTLEVGENPSCGYPCVKQVIHHESNIDGVANLMTKDLLSTLDQWSSTYQEGELIKQTGENTWVYHVRHDCWIFPARDFVYVVHQKRVSKNTVVILNASIQWQDTSVFKNCIRGKIYPSIIRITQMDNTVTLERFSTAAPRGYIPGLLYQVAFFPLVVDVFQKDAAKLKKLLSSHN